MTPSRDARSLTSSVEAEPSGAVTDLLDFGVCHVREREKKIRGGLFVFDRDVPVAFQSAVGSADDCGGRSIAVMSIAIAHTAAEVDERAVQERAVAVGRRLQFPDELGKLARMIGRYLRVFLDALWLVSVVTDRGSPIGCCQ